MSRPRPFRWEPYPAAPESYLPFLWIASRRDTWEGLATDYLRDIEDRLEPNPLVNELAVQLVRRIDDPEARIETFLSYVQEYSYEAIVFGRRARVPDPVGDVVARKYGDCKDHSLLLVHLLGSIDVAAHLVLANTSERIAPEVPSLDQFNHMIVYIPDQAGGRFLDCTDKNHRIVAMPPLGLGGRLALVLDPEQTRIAKIPEYSAEQNLVVSQRTVQVLANGDAEIRETLTANGVSASSLRYYLRNTDETTRQTLVQQTMSESGPKVTVRGLVARHLDEMDKPLILEINYRASESLQPAGSELVGRIPAYWERGNLAAAHLEKRRTPFQLVYPMKLESTVTVLPPEGFQIATVEEPIPAYEDRFVIWSLREEPAAEGRTLHWEAQRAAGTHPEDLYSAFEESMNQALRSIEQKLVLRAAQ